MALAITPPELAKDILLIAVGSDMAMDAIEDLNREFNR